MRLYESRMPNCQRSFDFAGLATLSAVKISFRYRSKNSASAGQDPG